MNLVRFDPFGDLVDDFFRGFEVRPVWADAQRTAQPATIRLDVTDKDGAYEVKADLPGVTKDDISVTVDGDFVSIAAEVKKEREVKEGERVLKSERYFGRVARSFRLAAEIDLGAAQAKFENGVLRLTLPKKAAPSAKQLTVH